MPNPQIISTSGLQIAASANLTWSPPPLMQDGDILIAVIAGTTNGQVPAISGFSSRHSADGTNSAGHREVLWKRASGESGNYTTTGLSAGTNYGVLYIVRYATPSGDPISAISGTDKTNSGTALTCTSITPGVDGCLLMEATPQPNNASVSGWADTGPTLTWQEEFDVSNTASLGISSAVQPTAAAIVATATNSSTGFAHMIAIAIAPDTSVPTPPVGEPSLIARIVRRLGS
jgi:hypothetical protein